MKVAPVPADGGQELALNNTLLDVKFEHSCRRPPFRCKRLDHGCPKHEVVIPMLAPRVEQGDKSAALGINRTDIACIASKASIGKVAGIRLSTMLTADDVVNLMRRIRIAFVKEAILTSKARAFCDESTQRLVYVTGQTACVDAPALSP